MKLCLISNSTNAGEAYLGWPQEYIKEFLNKNAVKKVLFVPFAGVGLSADGLQASYDAYAERVAGVFNKLGFELESIHKAEDPKKAVAEAECVVVGGGNTFHLYYEMHRQELMSLVRERALNGLPYMGWSAGSNLACPTLKTTNDMPIIEPASFDGLNLVPFQINPHYLDANPEGHGGETREQRIEEFLMVNREMTVVGLREACLLEVDGDDLQLKGNRDMRIFQFGKDFYEVSCGSDLNFLK
ncbi:MAG: dipeptidase PepE [Bacteroidales bacterium]